jgi:lipopolysaccharide cholinephosphotransferase
MMEFEENFFREEVREGFLVPELMKRAWAAELEVLSLLMEICGRHGITWYADYGTLLGAVRHGGFVPWDDDIDICLKRPDYMRLLGILKEELPEGYVIHSIYTEPDCRQPWAALANGKTLCPRPDPWRLEHFHQCPFICGVDIYPLDYLPRDQELAGTQLLLYSAAYDGAQRCEELRASGELELYLPQLEQLCQTKFSKEAPLDHQLWKLADRLAMMFGPEDGDELTLMARMAMGDDRFRLKKEWYEKTVEIPFETIRIPVPKGYEEVLTVMYGDWKTPLQNTGAHGYPFYKEQMQVLGIS